MQLGQENKAGGRVGPVMKPGHLWGQPGGTSPAIKQSG